MQEMSAEGPELRLRQSADPAWRALDRLADLDMRKACIARMRLVGKLSVGQIASLLGMEEAAVLRDWRFARAWLLRETMRTRA